MIDLFILNSKTRIININSFVSVKESVPENNVTVGTVDDILRKRKELKREKKRQEREQREKQEAEQQKEAAKAVEKQKEAAKSVRDF